MSKPSLLIICIYIDIHSSCELNPSKCGNSDLDKQTSIVIYQFWAEDAPERNITSFSKLPLRKGIKAIP